MNPFADLLSLFYPQVCHACGEKLLKKGLEEVICLRCQYHLPKTGFHLLADNPVTQKFWGRVNVQHGTAMYYFTKEGRVQTLVHKLKYQDKPEVGIKLGQMTGTMLATSELYSDIDLIVPVPLHPKKLRLRGYNQASMFAQGISETFGKPWTEEAVRRGVHTETQTRKNRFERFLNVEYAFLPGDTATFQNKHILLVDDVLTTGSTIESCANILLTIPGVRVSVACIAVAL